jgi:hypothetical protein
MAASGPQPVRKTSALAIPFYGEVSDRIICERRVLDGKNAGKILYLTWSSRKNWGGGWGGGAPKRN